MYLNPKIWIYTPFTVQRELLTALGRHVDKQPARLRNHCGLSQTLEVLREFYWDKATTPSAVGVRPLLHPVTHEVIGQRPTSQEVRIKSCCLEFNLVVLFSAAVVGRLVRLCCRK